MDRLSANGRDMDFGVIGEVVDGRWGFIPLTIVEILRERPAITRGGQWNETPFRPTVFLAAMAEQDGTTVYRVYD